MRNDKGNIVTASLAMVGITMILFFLPFINGLIGGAVGGYMLGDTKRAITAAVLPAIVVSILLWVVVAMFGAPIIGFFAGMAGGVLILFVDVGIFIGALAGAWFGSRASQGGLRV